MTAPPAGGAAASALLTDLYQLTMLDAYYRLGLEQTAVFEFFVRRLPPTRNFLVAAGLEQVLDYLETLHFTAAELDWLETTRRFSPTLLHRLERLRFSGDVWAMPEGTVFFANEPVVRVTAPLPEAQLIESRLINLMHYQTLVASKAARCRLVAPSSQLVDFGMRRAHAGEAALLSARAAYIAGFDATATVDAGRRYGIPVVGTMGHSFIQAHDLEAEAFRNFARCKPQDVVLLIDTYDTINAAHRVAKLAAELRSAGSMIRGVRIDSGDLAIEARRVRDILDAAGCRDIRILVSGSLDEQAIEAMQAVEAPIDTYCLGTRISVSDDAPSLDCVYKLQEYAGKPRRKLSLWKETWPGARQVYRQSDAHGQIGLDFIACADEIAEGRALLRQVMTQGRRLAPSPPMSDVRQHCRNELATLPPALAALEKGPQPPVKISARLHALAHELDTNNNRT
jgi:nicotinate phosphoribosyltransferase